MNSAHDVGLQLFVDRLMARSVLSEEEQQAVLKLPFKRADIRAKLDVVGVNEKTTHSCFVASGLVGRFGQSADGTRQTTAFHIPGDMADLHSAVRPIGVGGLNALSDTVILRVPHTAIRALAARYPAIAEAFWRDCLLDAAVLMQWVVNVGRRDAPTRLAHIFCEMAIRYGTDQEALEDYTFPVSQAQLADAASLTTVHVNRSLKVLREMKLVTMGRQTVKIHDWGGLASHGDFYAAYLVADTKAERMKRSPETA